MAFSLLRLSLLAALAVTIASCGFTPVYAPKEVSERPAPLPAIHIAPIAGKRGVLFEKALAELLRPGDTAPSAAARYDLMVTLEQNEVAAIIGRDGRINRYNVTTTVRYRLTDRQNPTAAPWKGNFREIGSYNVSASEFATHVARQQVIERSLDLAAHALFMRLAASFADAP